MIATVSNEKGLPVYHLDVSQPFVQAPLKKEIPMRLSPGCSKLSRKVVRLLKCQYGLMQAGKVAHVSGKLAARTISLKQCKTESCRFQLIVHDEMSSLVRVHVDNLILKAYGGKKESEI